MFLFFSLSYPISLFYVFFVDEEAEAFRLLSIQQQAARERGDSVRALAGRISKKVNKYR